MKRNDYILCVLFLLITACSSLNSPQQISLIQTVKPTSILVMPPTNQSIQVSAALVYLSTITKPLAEKGYYVFPVSVVTALFRAEGLNTSNEMSQVPLERLNKVFAADAVLYSTISDWGQKYQLLNSVTRVDLQLTLVQASTGAVLWQGRNRLESSSNNQQSSSITSMLVGALVNQVAGSIVDQTPRLSRQAITNMLNHPTKGLLAGPYLKNIDQQ